MELVHINLNNVDSYIPINRIISIISNNVDDEHTQYLLVVDYGDANHTFTITGDEFMRIYKQLTGG